MRVPCAAAPFDLALALRALRLQEVTVKVFFFYHDACHAQLQSAVVQVDRFVFWGLKLGADLR